LQFIFVRDTDSAVKLESAIQKKIQAWQAAGLIDAATAARLSAYETAHERRTGLQWPVIVALLFGGILVAAGITLFVAAHWADMSPAARFSVVLVLVGAFHVAGTFTAEKFPALATTFHGIGTAALGAGIFLAAQIFNLHENWATGVLLWAVGAAAGYALLRDWVQAAFVALLVPAWLISEWQIATYRDYSTVVPFFIGLLSLSIAYLTARIGDDASSTRRLLAWIGGLSLLPVAVTGILMASDSAMSYRQDGSLLPGATVAITWAVALVLPLALAFVWRGVEVWINVAYVAWAALLFYTARFAAIFYGAGGDLLTMLLLYVILAVGSIGFVWWGLRERRRERINLGITGFALSVLGFYFSSFMGKLGRSASLIGLGILCLAGGFALEKMRRRLVAKMEATS
jgi:uncharacterized membrane protein